MKKIFFVIMAVALSVTSVFAASATFSWLPNSETDLAGYKIYYGAVCGEYDNFVDVGLPAVDEDGRVYGIIENIPDGATCYAATAYDNQVQESDYSDVVEHDAVPGAPDGFGNITINVTVNVH